MNEQSDRGEPVPDDVDEPSAAVLDELLRAFSAEPDAAERLAAVDLTSPEVAELLEPRLLEPSPVAEPHPRVDVDTDIDEDLASHGQLPAVSEPIDPLLQPVVERDAGADVDEDPSSSSADGPGIVDPPIDPLLHPAVPRDDPPGGSRRGRTIVIGGDSLRDVQDLGGVASSGRTASTVFIDDANTGADTYGASDASATRVEPRLRQRRIAVRRSASRRRLRWVVIASLVVVGLIAGLAVLGSSWFAVSEVEVEGRLYSERAAVDAVVDDLLGTPVLRVDTESAEATLEAIPWVADAVVTTRFPDRAKIELRERDPVAWFTGADGRFRIVDREGRVLDVLAGEPIEYFRIDAVDPPSPDAGAFAPRGVAVAAALADALTPTMTERASMITVTPDGGDLRMILDGGTEVRFGRGEDLITKLVRLETVLDDETVVGPSVIDVATADVTVQ